MAVIPNQKFRFLGGEVSPNLYHSADMEQYGKWFSKAENIRFDTLGAFRNRTGFEKIAETKVSNGTAIKLLSFNFSKDESYLIEMGPTYFRFFEDGVPVYKDGDPEEGVYEISHNMSIIDGDIKYAQSGDIMYLVNGVDPIGTLTRNDTTGYNWTFAAFKFKNNCYPLLETNADDTKTLTISNSSGTLTVTSSGHDFFENKHAGDTFAVEKSVPAQSQQFDGGAHSSAGSTSLPILSNGVFSVNSTGSWSGVVDIEYSKDNGSTWEVLYSLFSNSTETPHNINTSFTVSNQNTPIKVRVNVKQNLVWNTYPLQMYLFSQEFSYNSYYKIATKNSATSAVCTCEYNPIDIADGYSESGIIDWKEAAFSTEAGYPSVVGFYQNRLFFGKEYYLYGSKTNDFYDFYAPTTLIASDPITMSLLSYRYNRIKNILTVRKFFVFSEEGEFGIQSQNALTQTDKNLIPLSYHGSNDCLPVLAGNLALFVDQTGNCIRLFQYSYETDMFEANDASVFLEQILNKKELINGVLTQRQIVTTDYLKKTKEALFLDNFGTIWVFKLMPEQEVYAWSHWKYAGSEKITNMRVVANGPEEDLYIAVEDTNLSEKRIEKLSTDKFYDSEKTYTSELRTNRFYTDFAAGTEIVAEYEDKVSRMIVQDNGLIVLEKQVLSVTCHYIYVSTATLLSPTTNLTDGVYTTYNKGKPFKVYFAYQDSFGFKVGLEEEEKMIVHFSNGDRPDSSELTIGKRNVLIPARYDGSSRVTFIQERPYNMSINNIMIDMDYGGK